MAHNGNLGQLNPEVLNFAHDFAFIDHFKSFGTFSIPANLQPSPVKMNAQGLPIDLSDGQWSRQGYIPPASEYSGNWIIDWVGEMTQSMSVATTVSGSLSGVNGRWEGTLTSAESRSHIITAINASNPPTQTRLYRKDHESLLLSGEIFTPLFLEKCGKAGILRMDLNWQFPNGTNVAKWADRMPVDYCSYAGAYWKPSLLADGNALTSHSGDNYSVAKTGFVLADKVKIHLIWDFTNTTTTPTLNVEGTGAKVIKREILSAVSAGACPINKRETLTYELAHDCWMVSGISFQQGIYAGVPPEIVLALNNKLNTHPQLIIPHMAAEFQTVSDATDKIGGITDYTSGLATLHRDGLNPGLVPRYSLGNEIFNGATNANPYANARSLSRWASSFQFKDWQGRGLALVGAALASVYSGSGKTYKLLCDVQSVGTPDIATNKETRMESTRHVADGGNPAKNYVTDICMANYWVSRCFSPSQDFTTFSRCISDGWDAWGASQATIDAIVHDLYYDADGAQFFIEGIGLDRLTTWYNCAQQYGIGLTFYEGGNSPDELTANPRMRVLGISKAAQAVVALDVGHGLRTGMKVIFRDIQGMTEVNNNTYDVTAHDAAGGTITINVNSTGFTTFTNGTAPSGPTFSTSNPVLRGIGFAFAADGTTAGKDVCNALKLAYRDGDAAEEFTLMNLQQCVSLPGCHSPSLFDLSGNGPWSGHPGTIYTENGAWRGFVDFSEQQGQEVQPISAMAMGLQF